MDCGWIVLQGCESWSKEALQARRDCCATSEWTRLLYEWKFPVVLPLHLPVHVREQKIDGGNPNLLASTSQKPFLLCVWSQVWIHRNHFCFLSLCVYSSSTTPDTWQQYNSYFTLQCWHENKVQFHFWFSCLIHWLQKRHHNYVGCHEVERFQSLRGIGHRLC